MTWVEVLTKLLLLTLVGRLCRAHVQGGCVRPGAGVSTGPDCGANSSKSRRIHEFNSQRVRETVQEGQSQGTNGSSE